MASKTVYCNNTGEYRISTSAYIDSLDAPLLNEYDHTQYRCGRMTFPAVDIGSATLNSATLYYRAYSLYDEGVSRTIRIAASNTATAYTTAISSGYATDTDSPDDGDLLSVDIKSLLNGISDYNSTFYIFGIQQSPDYDESHNNGLSYYGSAHDGTSPYTSYRPYITITYTPSTDSQLYIGTASGNKVCDVYIGTAGGNKKVTDIYIGTAGGNKRVEL